MDTEDLHRNCIAFGEWIVKSPFHQTLVQGEWKWFDTSKSGDLRSITYKTEELFQIYLNELNND